jgi:transposase-like protein
LVAELGRPAALRPAPACSNSTESAATNFIISTHVERADCRIWTERGRPYHRFTKETKALIVKLYRHDYKIHNLSEAFNCSTKTIWKIVKNAGVKTQYSRRPCLVGPDNELKYRLDPVKQRSKVKIWFNKAYTRRQHLKRVLEAFSCWIIYLLDHTFEGDWLDLACRGERPP